MKSALAFTVIVRLAGMLAAALRSDTSARLPLRLVDLTLDRAVQATIPMTGSAQPPGGPPVADSSVFGLPPRVGFALTEVSTSYGAACSIFVHVNGQERGRRLLGSNAGNPLATFSPPLIIPPGATVGLYTDCAPADPRFGIGGWLFYPGDLGP